MIKGLHHNAYRCRDSEETRRFYEEFLGLPLVHTLKIEGRQKDADYVFHAVKAVRAFLDQVSPEVQAQRLQNLQLSYSRGLSPGFFIAGLAVTAIVGGRCPSGLTRDVSILYASWVRVVLSGSRSFRAGLVALAGGWLLGALGVCPVVKRIWTPSWALYSAGLLTPASVLTGTFGGISVDTSNTAGNNGTLSILSGASVTL